MKISINSIFVGLLIILANKMSAQLQIQYKNYTGTGYDAAANYQSAGVASDFGPRVHEDNWHGGIDINGPSTNTSADEGDIFLAHRAGVIVDVNKVTHNTTNIRYPTVDYGNHRMLYVHAYPKACLNGCNMNDNTIVANNMIFPNNKKWATIFIIGIDTTVIGQDTGKVVFNGDTLAVSNHVRIGDPIAPMGISGTKNYHLHLNTVPDDKETYSDVWNANPLEHITYDVPNYILSLYSQSDTGTIKLVYPGTNVTPLALKVKLPNETYNANDGSYNTVMDCNKTVFGIKKSDEANNKYKIISGDFSTGTISLGGKINENIVNHTVSRNINDFGSWTKTGMNPKAYTTSSPRPWDTWYFSDFKTRIHKDDVLTPVATHLYADTPINARYIDGQYNIRVEAWHISNDSLPEYSEIENYTIDNFQPFIEVFNFRVSNESNVYSCKRTQNEGVVATLNDGKGNIDLAVLRLPILRAGRMSPTSTQYKNEYYLPIFTHTKMD